MWKAAEYVTKGGVDYAPKLLVKSLGPDIAKRVLDRVVKTFESSMAFTGLEKADPQQLSKFIQSEHPQTIALILAHLKPGQAAQLMQSLPEDLRVEVVTRMANLDEISPEVITRISSVIEQRLKSLGGQHARVVRRRARRGRTAQPHRPQRQPAGARGHRVAVAGPGGLDPQPDVRVRRPAARRRQRAARDHPARRQEGADGGAQGHVARTSATASSRTCPSAPST